VTTLKELNDREEMDFSRFIENLKTHEIKMKVRKGREPNKKKSVAFKANSSIEDQEESSEEGEEDFAMLIWKVKKCCIRRGDKVTTEEVDHRGSLKRRRWSLLLL